MRMKLAKNQLMLEKMDKSPQGMPQDLLDFLNDVGPLERKVNKERTSPKVYESLKSEEEQVRKKVEESRMRKRRIMPMVEHSSDGEEAEEDGTATSRTTNFSSTNKEEDNQHLRLTDSELFGFLTQLKDNKVTAKEIVTQHFENNGEPILPQDRTVKHIDSIKNMNKFIGIPILMEDTDKSIIGAWSHRIEDLKSLKIKMAQENIRLAMSEPEQLFVNVISQQLNPKRVKSETMTNTKSGADATRDFLKSQNKNS